MKSISKVVSIRDYAAINPGSTLQQRVLWKLPMDGGRRQKGTRRSPQVVTYKHCHLSGD